MRKPLIHTLTPGSQAVRLENIIQLFERLKCRKITEQELKELKELKKLKELKELKEHRRANASGHKVKMNRGRSEE